MARSEVSRQSVLGQLATLVERPDGKLSGEYAFTVGKAYRVVDTMGPLLVVETDEPGVTASVHRSRFVVEE